MAAPHDPVAFARPIPPTEDGYRITFDLRTDGYEVWAPDGTRFMYIPQREFLTSVLQEAKRGIAEHRKETGSIAGINQTATKRMRAARLNRWRVSLPPRWSQRRAMESARQSMGCW